MAEKSSANDLACAESQLIKPIGVLHSPFKEKFGIPRQSGLITSATATVEFFYPYNDPGAFKGLEKFSHIWLTFSFHKNDSQKWRPLIRPPRLGGNEKTGVFASRSPFRPNGLGISAVELLTVHTHQGIASLKISCPDILDGTPIFDIKPYIKYSDSLPHAQSGFAQHPPSAKLEVQFTPASERSLEQLNNEYDAELRALITETLSYDPRPAYKQDECNKEYGIQLYDLNIRWRVSRKVVEVRSITQI